MGQGSIKGCHKQHSFNNTDPTTNSCPFRYTDSDPDTDGDTYSESFGYTEEELVSTDIIGAAIRAYVSALNKIVYDQNNSK